MINDDNRWFTEPKNGDFPMAMLGNQIVITKGDIQWGYNGIWNIYIYIMGLESSKIDRNDKPDRYDFCTCSDTPLFRCVSD